ncbi:MAG: xanthine dehydrogenase molybdopterin binding subunit [Alphaproteobacteria bacterium HGW-Alphaproteobacteria-2]|nr:MAG: xanthine dehydrogenase molybdopterin binding subunit [Alphaproteobacteria bacterium HGW-Alphaproteobacteria-2]
MSIARPLPHDAAPLHVTGQARYVDDVPLPAGALHLAFGMATIARGQITGMDLSSVRAAPGVVAVWSGADFDPVPDCSPSAHDEPLLSDGSIHFHGQPVFLVAAESHLAARRAARQARIDYAEDFYLEGQVAAALPQEGGDMVVLSSSQHPTEIQHKVAHALGVPMHAVRVEVRRMGGGFGGKESQGNWLAIACAVAARATGRPCKMRYDRDDDMTLTGKRHDFRIDYEAGFDAAGRILGVSFVQYTRGGWSRDLTTPVADRAMLHADNAYHLPAARIESHRLRTNMASATAFRGFGGPQGMLGIERVMDHIAHDLGRDPLEVRRANFYAAAPAAPQTTPYGQEVEDFVLHEMLAALEESSDYAARRTAIAEWNAESPILKRGLALTPVKFGISFTLTHLNQAGALVHLYQDGSIHLNHGGTEMGQGLFQKVAQVAAQVFGQPVERVKITATDTGKVPNTSATAASSGSDLNGMAVKVACETITGRIAAFLATEHQTEPARIAFRDGAVFVGDERLEFADVARRAWEGRVSLSATGFYATPGITWDRARGQGRPFYYFAYGVAATEVVIDKLTGENRILRADILHDAGASLNPAIDLGQVEGGYVQGAGWLTTEELVWDNKGRLATHAPSTYKIPACSDRPPVFNAALWDKGRNREDTIYRSKAVGEPPFMLGISALMALSDAVGACGDGAVYPALDAPATAERVLWAVCRQREGRT